MTALLMLAGCQRGATVDPCGEPQRLFTETLADLSEANDRAANLFDPTAARQQVLLHAERLSVIAEQNPDCFTAQQRADTETFYRAALRVVGQ